MLEEVKPKPKPSKPIETRPQVDHAQVQRQIADIQEYLKKNPLKGNT